MTKTVFISRLTCVEKHCLLLVFRLQGEVDVPAFEKCAGRCWHRESAWTCISGQHMNLSWRKTEWLPSSWLRNAAQGSPDFRVSLSLVLFRESRSHFPRCWLAEKKTQHHKPWTLFPALPFLRNSELRANFAHAQTCLKRSRLTFIYGP